MRREKTIHIVGGGLAGCEAAYQVAKCGIKVMLYDMKPARFSPAHESESLGELVCSNSFRSDDINSAVGLLKEEMTLLDSLIIRSARKTAVPAGKALAVDRNKFADYITETMEQHPLIEIHRKEVSDLDDFQDELVILATGPLTSDQLATSLARITSSERLYFYDAIAPIIEKDSLNMDIVYQKSRYDDGPGDYLNCPMNREEYTRFIATLMDGDCVPLHSFEKPKYFEGCLPVEVMCSRGVDTLRFGPMKPVGLTDPRTGEDPFAVVQLRKENIEGSHYNMVGFQTKLTYGAQKEIFRTIPGMEKAVFSRFGSIHRNTFICAPDLLMPSLQLNTSPHILIAGQLSGVEGYVESAAMGLLAGINGGRLINNVPTVTPPKDTATGALIDHLTQTVSKRFQPSNVNFGLFPPIGKKMPKKLRGPYRSEQALQSMKNWLQEEKLTEKTDI